MVNYRAKKMLVTFLFVALLLSSCNSKPTVDQPTDTNNDIDIVDTTEGIDTTESQVGEDTSKTDDTVDTSEEDTSGTNESNETDGENNETEDKNDEAIGENDETVIEIKIPDNADKGFSGNISEDIVYFWIGEELHILGTGDIDTSSWETFLSLGKDKAKFSSTSTIIIDGALSSIPDMAFKQSDFSEVVEIVLPSTLKVIGNEAFSNLYNLQRINLPDSIETIGVAAFNNCKSLQYIEVPDVKNLGTNLFRGCEKLENITIHSEIKAGTLNGCDNIIELEVNKKYNKIDRGIVYSADGTQVLFGISSKLNGKLDIADGTKEIVRNAFFKCTNVTEILLPDTLEIIRENAFCKCGITSIKIPSSVTIIDSGAFSDCKSLTQASLPDGLKEISKGLFLNCENLTDIKIPKTIEVINSTAFGNCSKLELDIPSTVKTIESEAFNGVKSIKYSGSATGSPWGAVKAN